MKTSNLFCLSCAACATLLSTSSVFAQTQTPQNPPRKVETAGMPAQHRPTPDIASDVLASFYKTSQVPVAPIPGLTVTGDRASHLRAPDGSIKTTSVVDWGVVSGNYGGATKNYGWRSSMTLYIDRDALSQYFAPNNPAYPDITWTYSGQGTWIDKIYAGTDSGEILDPIEDVHNQNAKLVVALPASNSAQTSSNADFLNVPLAGIGSGFPRTGQVKAKVKDLNDNTERETTYDIEWHLPAENWRRDPTKPIEGVALNQFVVAGPLGTSNQDGTGTTDIQSNGSAWCKFDNENVEFDYGPAVKTGSVILATAGAVAPSISAYVVPGIAATSVSVWGPASLLVFGAAVTSIVDVSPPDVTPQDVRLDFERFKHAVETQYRVNNGLQAATPYDDTITGYDADQLEAAHTSFNNTDQYNNSYFPGAIGKLTATVQPFFKQRKFYYVADGYDIHGYTGQVSGTLVRNIGYYYKVQWTVKP